MALEEDDKQMARIGLSKYFKLETLQEMINPQKKEAPSHENNMKSLKEVLG